MNRMLHGVYLVTDTTIQDRFTNVQLARMAIEAGVQMIQYRNKQGTAREAIAEIREIAEITSGTHTTFIVNDRGDLALAGNADGVHLGQDDLPIPAARAILGENIIIGGTSSTPEEALQVQQAGADYVALGHIFETTTKRKGYPPRGLDTLNKAAAA
ncbi:MAG: thiamine phosphate synthase, partial [Balneolaceae bacterium]|nr:thiamine phosphate synthase [Balneolaceae bacterium]